MAEVKMPVAGDVQETTDDKKTFDAQETSVNHFSWNDVTNFLQDRTSFLKDVFIGNARRTEQGMNLVQEGNVLGGVKDMVGSTMNTMANVLTFGYADEIANFGKRIVQTAKDTQKAHDDEYIERNKVEKVDSLGQFVTEKDGARFDVFEKGTAMGTTRKVGDASITYLGQGPVERVEADKKSLFESTSYIAVTDEQRGTMVHYEGPLGSFNYNTRDFELAEYTPEGGEARQVLHYRGDKPIQLMPWGVSQKVDGEVIGLPEGIVNADYMFAGTAITSMPDIAKYQTLVSAEGMFQGCKNMTDTAFAAKDLEGKVMLPASITNQKDIFKDSGVTGDWKFVKVTEEERIASLQVRYDDAQAHLKEKQETAKQEFMAALPDWMKPKDARTAENQDAGKDLGAAAQQAADAFLPDWMKDMGAGMAAAFGGAKTGFADFAERFKEGSAPAQGSVQDEAAAEPVAAPDAPVEKVPEEKPAPAYDRDAETAEMMSRIHGKDNVSEVQLRF